LPNATGNYVDCSGTFDIGNIGQRASERAAARQRAPLGCSPASRICTLHSKLHHPPTTPCLYLTSPAWSTTEKSAHSKTHGIATWSFSRGFECGASWTADGPLSSAEGGAFRLGIAQPGAAQRRRGECRGGNDPAPAIFAQLLGGRGPLGLWAYQEGQMGQKRVCFEALRGTRSRQDESIEVGEVGSKRSSLGCNGVHVVWWIGLIFRLLWCTGSHLVVVRTAPSTKISALPIEPRVPSGRCALPAARCLRPPGAGPHYWRNDFTTVRRSKVEDFSSASKHQSSAASENGSASSSSLSLEPGLSQAPTPQRGGYTPSEAM
jgi:hypothetical protein